MNLEHCTNLSERKEALEAEYKIIIDKIIAHSNDIAPLRTKIEKLFAVYLNSELVEQKRLYNDIAMLENDERVNLDNMRNLLFQLQQIDSLIVQVTLLLVASGHIF